MTVGTSACLAVAVSVPAAADALYWMRIYSSRLQLVGKSVNFLKNT
jgi:hypothetical protein